MSYQYQEDDYLQLSGLQHFCFCRRQWALIHIENQWAENYRTVDGELMHENAHNADFQESRGDLLIVRGLAIHSARLGVSGQCDVVEFRRSPDGVSLRKREGLWQPYPIEYKRGKPKEGLEDKLQLCGQAMLIVSFTQELRGQVQSSLEEMHDLYQKRYTPKVKPTKSCNACSLKDICVPKLLRAKKVADYLSKAMEELQ